jgi:hypothetical protein
MRKHAGLSDFKKFFLTRWIIGCVCEEESEGFEKILRNRKFSVLVLQDLSVAFEIIRWIYPWECINQVIQQVNKNPLYFHQLREVQTH